ncbi:MAG: RIP metalloprotease RseP [Proteobacteria bacterium]|nr:RIP metalloprotease RseP [Pseudomonadota bacterium]MBU4286572.1 RIP metalloprotease RseP [Pseudomonadota bacterium]MBU4414468.1 RIP metalloprotease RseP [Pseudomonadota bacterium]MCG2757538.1 RIP metalloprotease RseP [Desulfobacteraceae bacterium]
MSTNIVAFIIVLGILILFHELGHFLIARLFGVGVEKFSIGFGPKIFGKRIGNTDYRISAIPLGGFVKMVGEEPGAEVAPDHISISFTHKHVFKRILIVAAGPFFNLLLAIIIFFGMFQIYGTFILEPSVGEVKENSPASRGELKKGDRIVAINEIPIESWDDMAKSISKSNGEEIELYINREESIITVNIKPELTTTKNIFGEDIQRYVIGITSSGDGFSKELNFFQAFYESIIQTYNISKLTVISIVKLLQGAISTKTLGGPLMIAQMAGQQAEEGISNLLFFIALLSINLGIINFLPIPVLDGGHLVFFFIEAATGRPVNVKFREIAQQVGIFVLVMLMIYVFYNDITRMFFS